MLFPIAGLADWIDADGNPLYFFYEQLADVCTRCSDIMMGFACVVIFAGMVMQVSKGMFAGDISGLFKHIVLIGLAVWAMQYYPEWFLDLQRLLGEDLLVALEVDPLSMLINFGKSFEDAPFDTGSAPSIVFGVIDPMTWFEYFAQIIGAFVMAVISIFMYVAFYIGFQIQIMAIYLGCAVGPLFIAMLLFEPTRDSAVKYHVGMVGICFWPLGWGIGMLFGEAMMEAGLPLIYAILYALYLIGGPFIAMVSGIVTIGGMLIIIIIVLAWFLVTLFGAPKVAQKAVTTGAQLGMSLIQGGISASTTMATAAVSAGVQAASGAAQVAGGAALAIGTGGAGAAVGGSMIASGAGSAAGSLGTLAGGVTSAASAASKAADNN